MAQKPITLVQFLKQFPTDEACLQHLFEVRFGQGFECPRCERSAKWYRIEAERAYSCGYCGNHLHPTVGTPFHRTRTPLQSWFYAVFMFTTTRNGFAAKELQRQIGVTYKTAWRMCFEIRKHMAAVDGENMVGGAGAVVEIDETLIGGKTKGLGTYRDGKTYVMGMMERGGEIITKVVPNNRQSTMIPIIREKRSPRHRNPYRRIEKLSHPVETRLPAPPRQSRGQGLLQGWCHDQFGRVVLGAIQTRDQRHLYSCRAEIPLGLRERDRISVQSPVLRRRDGR